MSHSAFFWFEFSLLVGGCFTIEMGEQSYGVIEGAALATLGCVMCWLTVFRSGKTQQPLKTEASPPTRK